MDYGRFKMLEVTQDFLLEMLADGERPAKKIYEEGLSYGLSERTLDRAKAHWALCQKATAKRGASSTPPYLISFNLAD